MGSLRLSLFLALPVALSTGIGCSGEVGAHSPGAGGSGNAIGTAGAGNGSGGGANGTGTAGAGAGPAPIAGLMIFYSDLTSGPNSGGENDKGAYVTIWGNGFGASQGGSTVT